jgi:poly(3-hydroxybutyrate) depolymerase
MPSIQTPGARRAHRARRARLVCAFLASLFSGCAVPRSGPATIQVTSSLDGASQPAILSIPAHHSGDPRPLLVLLHTWSADYRQREFAAACQPLCDARRWILLRPDFRGPNRTPAAAGSELAVRDVLDAIDAVRRRAWVDRRRIYLVGTSGGGHMSLLLATRAPQLFAAVSAWVPVSDLAAWHAEIDVPGGKWRRYARDLERVCGGPPGASPAVDARYHARSPLPHLAQARGLPIDIATGLDDGHLGSVPIRHSLRAFNALAVANGAAGQQFDTVEIEAMTRTRQVPAGLQYRGPALAGRRRPVLVQRDAGPVRVTIFAGGHEGDMPAAIEWLATHRRAVGGG